MATDEAWMEFRKNSSQIQKASISEKLDALAAILQETRTDTQRMAQVVPKILGDEGAIDAANAGADPMQGASPMGGMPGMGPDMPMAPGATPGVEAMDSMMDTGKAPLPEDIVLGQDVPGAGAPADPMLDEDALSDAEMDDLLNGGPEGDMPLDVAATDGGVQDGAASLIGDPLLGGMDPASMGDDELTSAASNLLNAIKEAAHKAVDSGDTDKIVTLSQLEQNLTEAFGGMGVSLQEADLTTGPEAVPGDEDMAEPEGTLDEAPVGPVDAEEPAEVGDDMDSEKPPFDKEDGESEDDSEGSDEAEAPEGHEDSPDGADDDKDKPEDEPKEEGESDSESESEDVKKSAADAMDSVLQEMMGLSIMKAEPEAPAQADIVEAPEDAEPAKAPEQAEAPAIAKSMPSFKSIMDGKFDVDAFMKGDASAEPYVDEAEIFEETPEDAYDGCDGNAFAKMDDRIATARNIFDVPTKKKGQKDPASIATARTYQEIDQTQHGEQDSEGISTAEPAIDITKSGVSEPAFGGKVADVPGGIHVTAFQTPAVTMGGAKGVDDNPVNSVSENIATQGDQKPESIATAEPAFDMGQANGSEGSTENLDIIGDASATHANSVHKSEDVGKPIMSLKEMMSIAKSGRPLDIATVNGDITPAELGVKKSSKRAEFKPGMDPWAMVEDDLQEYKRFMERSTF